MRVFAKEDWENRGATSSLHHTVLSCQINVALRAPSGPCRHPVTAIGALPASPWAPNPSRQGRQEILQVGCMRPDPGPLPIDSRCSFGADCLPRLRQSPGHDLDLSSTF